MPEPVASPRISCLSIVLSGLVALGVGVAVRSRVAGLEPLPWSMAAVAVVAALAVFLFARRALGLFWATLAAVLVALHPCLRQPLAPGSWPALLAETAVLVGLAAAAVGAQVVFLSRLAWRVWPFVGIGLAAAIGLAWTADTRAGVLAAGTAAVGLVGAAVLGRLLRLRGGETRPARLNLGMALVVAAAAPLVGLLTYHLLQTTPEPGEFWAPLLEAHQADEHPGVALSLAQLNRWFWPYVWLTGPLLLLGWWRTVRRGSKQWQRGEPPLAWLLAYVPLAVLPVSLFWPLRAGDAQPLLPSALTVLLTVFLVADLLRAGLRRLVLPPPFEREEVAAGSGPSPGEPRAP